MDFEHIYSTEQTAFRREVREFFDARAPVERRGPVVHGGLLVC